MIFDAVHTRSLLILFTYRKTQELSLSSVYNSGTTRVLTYIFGPPFLNPSDMNISEDATFPPCIWADHSSCVERTTNTCESFHQKFNGSF
nr:unnamed protein product [Callosobruchus analis]